MSTLGNYEWIETSSGDRPDHGPFLVQRHDGSFDLWNTAAGFDSVTHKHWAYFNPPETPEDRAWRKWCESDHADSKEGLLPGQVMKHCFLAGYRAGKEAK